MTSPSVLYVAGLAALVRLRAGAPAAVTVLVAGSDATGVVPSRAWPRAVLVMLPASRSAWVTVCVAVQVTLAPGARLAVVGQLTLTLSSLTVTGPARVTLPPLVTLYV